MIKSFHPILFLILLLASGSSYAASYSLPGDIGSGAFASCSGSGGVFNCTGDINLGNGDTVVLTGDVTLNISGNLDIGKDANISNSGFIFNINVTGNVDLGKDAFVSANITAGGDFKTGKKVNYIGNVVAAGDVDIDKDNFFTGDVTAGGTLNIGNNSVVVGVCSPAHPQCTGGGGGTGTTCTITQIAADGEEFRGISGSSDNNVIAVGKNGGIYHYDGTTWTKNVFVSNEDLRDIEVVNSSLAFAVGKNGKVVQYDGSTWTTLPAPTGEDLEGVWAISSTEVWVTGKNNALYLWNGVSWQDMSGGGQANVDNGADLKDAWGDSSSFYTVEKDGDLYRYTRTGGPWDKFNACNSSFDMDAEDIWGDGSGNIYIAGKDKGANPDEAAVFLYNEGTNSCSKVFSTSTENKLEGISGNGSVVYGVGKKGLVLDNSSGTWSESKQSAQDLKDVWVSGSGTAYYAGKNGFVTVCNAPTTAIVDHFNINVGGGSANTCNPFSFIVTAEDSGNNPVTSYTGTILITTDTTHGNFSTVTATNSIIPNPDNDDNGSASYTFDALDSGTVTLAISNDHAETLTLSVADSSIPVTSLSTNINFSDNAFTIMDSDLLVAGDNVPVAGRNHSYQVQMIRKDPIVGCGVATGYTGLKPLKMWRTKNASDPSPNNPVLQGTSLPATDQGVNGNITFVNGVADVTLATVDIGQFTIELADISNTFADITIAGTSAEQTVRPFGLAVTSIIAGATPNPGTSTPAGAIFTNAGSNFSATVSGVLWDAPDDLDNDGLLDAGRNYLDNSIAPSYAWDTTLGVSAAGFTPATGAPGVLNNNTILLAEFSGGAFIVNDLQYTEVGSFTLQSTAIDFLGEPTADITGDDIIVGRFIPSFFQISVTDNGALENTCGVYTYIGEDFAYSTPPAFTVSAMNALPIPTVTQNYRDAYVKLNASSVTVDVAIDTTTLGTDGMPLNVSFTSAPMIFTPQNDGTVDYTFGPDTIRYGPDSVVLNYSKEANSEIAPFTGDLDPVLTQVGDGEVTTIINPALAFDVIGNQLRFGRIRMSNVFGSELIDLAMPMIVDYLVSSGIYAINTDDVCTTVADGHLVVVPNLTGPGTSTVTVTNPTAIAGDLGVTLTAPGAGTTGDINISPDLDLSVDKWLRWDWNATGQYDADPNATATFGIFSGNPVQIYIEQTYQ